MRRGVVHTCDLCQAIVNRYKHGLSVAEIARDLGLLKSSVSHRLQYHGVLSLSVDRRRHVCSTRCTEITTAYQSGDTLETVGRRFAITRERVRQILAFHNFTARRRRYYRHRCDDVCTAVQVAPSPLVVRELARSLNVPPSTIKKIAVRHGIETVAVPTRHVCTDRCRQMIAGYEAGESTVDLSARFDLTQSLVCRLLRRHGVTLRSRRAASALWAKRYRQRVAEVAP